MHWDLFCRVIDNHGDLGVCWRLAREIAARGGAVRLFVDDARALAWMAPQPLPGVQVLPWPAESDTPACVGEVVIEAFGCDPPAGFVAAMGSRSPAPVWINLEYLSAEAYVERSHGLPSPQAGGLIKWFFYPGFTARTGGLLRSPGALADRAGFDGRAWLAAQGWAARPGEQVMSLFAYPHLRLADWLPALAAASGPLLLLAAPGAAAEQMQALPPLPGVRGIALPWLAQPDYDRLLQACDLNLVRGEDSFTQAQWSPAPLLWHIYPQHDGVHAGKLQAWLAMALDGAPAASAESLRCWMRRINGLDSGLDEGLRGRQPVLPTPDLAAWRQAHQAWRERLLQQDDLLSALAHFVHQHQGAAC